MNAPHLIPHRPYQSLADILHDRQALIDLVFGPNSGIRPSTSESRERRVHLGNPVRDCDGCDGTGRVVYEGRTPWDRDFVGICEECNGTGDVGVDWPEEVA